jgi:hypothetical protein
MTKGSSNKANANKQKVWKGIQLKTENSKRASLVSVNSSNKKVQILEKTR